MLRGREVDGVKRSELARLEPGGELEHAVAHPDEVHSGEHVGTSPNRPVPKRQQRPPDLGSRKSAGDKWPAPAQIPAQRRRLGFDDG